jgi:adenosine deaminase
MIDSTLPLVELHRHLDGNIRPQTIWELAQKNGLRLAAASVSDVEQLVQIKDKTSDLLAFLKKLDTGVGVLKTLEDCRRIAYENVEDAHLENIDYIELRFSPYYMALAHGLPLEGVVESVIDGVHSAVSDFPVKAQLIGILSRTYGAVACMQEINGLLALKDNICALDLAGDEINYPADLFVPHFNKARDAGWKITVHAGEADGPQSIWNAIKKLGASRIGHGVAAIKDQKLMQFMAEHRIGIESCPTSNYQTATVTDTANHPMKAFLEQGIEVTLSTDDPGVSAINLRHEYEVAHSVVGLSQAQLAKIQRFGVEQAFLSDKQKSALYEQARFKK